MTGIGYKKIYDILHVNLGDIMPDGNIIKIAQSVCVRASAVSRAEIAEELGNGKTHLYHIHEALDIRMREAFNGEETTASQAKDGRKSK